MSIDQQDPSDGSPSGVDPRGLPQWRLELQARLLELEQQNEALRRAAEQIIAERARYFDLYDQAPVGYCTLDPQGLMQEANLTAATLLGVSRGGLIKRPFSDFILKADQDTYDQYRKQPLEAGRVQSCELRMIRVDGAPFWAHLATSVAQNADGMALQRVILSDISESKFMDQALRETNVRLESAKLVADKANQAKSEFLSSMSHELRSPLNAILGFAQLMDSGSLPPTPLQKARIDHILQAGWHLLTLINEILDLATVESGKLSLSLEALSLAEVLSDCEAMMEPLAQQRGIRISFPQFDRPCLVHADRTRLKQVVINLLSNAIKYNRAEGTVAVGFSTDAGGGGESTYQRPGQRRGNVGARTGTTVPTLQSARTGSRRGGRQRHRPGGQQAPGRIDAGLHWRAKQCRWRQCVLDRTQSGHCSSSCCKRWIRHLKLRRRHRAAKRVRRISEFV